MIALVQMYTSPESDSSMAAVEIDAKIAERWAEYCDQVELLRRVWKFDQVRVPFRTWAGMVSPNVWEIVRDSSLLDDCLYGPIFVDGLEAEEFMVDEMEFEPAGWWLRVMEETVQLWTYDVHTGLEYESQRLDRADLEAIANGREPQHYGHV
jgi:hypothetical protein